MADIAPVEETSASEFIQVVVSASADGIVAVDDQGIIRLCNPAAEELLARPATQLVGREFGFPLAEGVAAGWSRCGSPRPPGTTDAYTWSPYGT